MITASQFLQVGNTLAGPAVYKVDTNNKLREFSVIVEGDSYKAITGVHEGKMVASKAKKAKPKNVGKVNETSAEQQALKEAVAKYTKKLKDGYCVSIEEAKSLGSGGKFISPMLASSKRPEDANVDDYIYDPKLDGMRLVVESTRCYSRRGNPVAAAKFTFERLQEWLHNHPNIVLDGELYNHKYKEDFNMLMSLARKQQLSTVTPQELYLIEFDLEYHIYDMIDLDNPNMGALERKQWLEQQTKLFAIPNIERVPYFLYDESTSKEEFEETLKRKIVAKQGYEGLIMRKKDAPYQIGKRSKHLIKLKEFEDSEFIIDNIYEGEGNRSDIAGTIGFIHNGRNYYMSQTGTKVLNKASIKGSHEYCEELLRNRYNYVGQKVTIRHFGMDPLTNSLRFPVAVDINRPD